MLEARRLLLDPRETRIIPYCTKYTEVYVYYVFQDLNTCLTTVAEMNISSNL